MPMWRCPHCGTPQAETARCWVCHRSSTACATCQNFRRSVAAQLGYCGLDRERRPLRGNEIRACWEASTIPIEVETAPARGWSPTPFDDVDLGTPVRKLEFVEVDPEPVPRLRRPATRAARTERKVEADVVAADTAPPVSPGEPRWSLWGDAEV
jgi:hypothetical protein